MVNDEEQEIIGFLLFFRLFITGMKFFLEIFTETVFFYALSNEILDFGKSHLLYVYILVLIEKSNKNNVK